MPRQIPYYDLLFHTVRYLVKRQVENRPTTLYQMAKRMGYGIEHLKGLMEEERVEYILIPHGDETNYKTTEILIRSIPQSIVVELGIANQRVEESFSAAFGEIEPISKIDLPEAEVEIVDIVDPISKYRIQDRTFEILKDQLITSKELGRKVARKGYPKSFVTERIIKQKLYEELSPVWRPFYYGKKIYFLKKAFTYVREIDPYCDNRIAAGRNKVFRNKRKKRQPDNPFLFSR